ncbi:MAG: S41 family peptidase [Saprospiraceae bacterium]
MKHFFTAIYILLTSGFISAQKIAKTNAIEDLVFLNDAVTNGHPVNYDSTKSKVTLSEVVQKLKNIDKDSFELTEFRLLLNEAIYKIGCVHTRISNETIKTSTTQKKYFPLILTLRNGKLADTLNNEIFSINGISSQILISDIEHFYASDGITNALSTQVFYKNNSLLISKYFNFPNEYVVNSGNQTFALKASKELPKSEVPFANNENSIIFKNANNQFYTTDNIPILKIGSFYKNDKSLFQKSFDYLKKTNSACLIIDLRGNLGGNRKSTIFLTKHLVHNSFSYSILQPKLNTKKYLDRKGKFFIFLSKLKYNVGNIFKGSRTELGREFAYNFKPLSNNFNGQIFVLTDGYTASASTMVTSWLKQHTKAKFIGQQSGGGYNGNNGGSFPTITLPNSKYQITFPAYRLILDRNSTQNEGIIPDIIIEPIIGKDNVLTQTIQLINSKN